MSDAKEEKFNCGKKRKAYKCKDKEQNKYILVVNEKPIDSLGWKRE